MVLTDPSMTTTPNMQTSQQERESKATGGYDRAQQVMYTGKRLAVMASLGAGYVV